MSNTAQTARVLQDESSLHCLEGVWVIIPAHNEEQSIAQVLADLPAVGRVIVVDNASTDHTAAIASSCGAIVVQELCKGYGAACLRGLAEVARQAEAIGLAPRIVVFLDGDYSDHPEQLVELVVPIQRGECEFVLGSRIVGDRDPGAMPLQAVLGNWLACFLMQRLWGARYTDLGPFRAIVYPSLLELDMRDRDFGWTVEMQVKAVQQGLRIREVPVAYRRRIGRSKISGTLRGTIMAGYKILFTIGRLWWRFRPPFHATVRSTRNRSQRLAGQRAALSVNANQRFRP